MVDTALEASLILDLLEWLATADRSHDDVMNAWRPSCPKLPVWEEANDRGLVLKEDVNGRCVVRITSSGRDLLVQSAIEENNMSNVAAMPPRINGILETSLYVESAARSAEFYRRVFGFEPLEPCEPLNDG